MVYPVETFLNRWLDNSKLLPTNLTYNGYSRLYDMIKVKDLILAIRFPKRGVADVCFLNSGSQYRGAEHPLIFTTRFHFMAGYFTNNPIAPNVKFYSFPFYALEEQNIPLRSLSVLDYNTDTEDTLFKQDSTQDNIYLFNKSISSGKSEAFIKEVPSCIVSLDDLNKLDSQHF